MNKSIGILTLLLLTAFSCKEDELSFSIKPSIGFFSTKGTLQESTASGIKVLLYTNTPITETLTVTITVNNFQNLEYGVDYTIDPQPVNNTITLTIEPENTSPSFFVYPTFNGKDRLISFEITDVAGGNFSIAQQVASSYLLNIKSLGCPSGIQVLNVTHTFDVCSDFATPTGFIEVFEAGSKIDRGWGCRNFGLNATRAVRASAFGGTAGEDKAWLIMNPVRIAAGSQVTIRFWVNSFNPGPGTVNVRWSSDYVGSGNPLEATWQELPTINSQFPTAGSNVWKEVTATFSDICGDNVYLAFRYTGATNVSPSSSWDIEDLIFTVQ